jgi:hypothetical protein
MGAGPPSGAGDVAPVVEQAPRRTRIRARLGVVLLLLGLAVAAVPGLAAGDDFLPRSWTGTGCVQIPLPFAGAPTTGPGPFLIRASGDGLSATTSAGAITIQASGTFTITGWPFVHSSLTGLVLHEPGWTAAAIALLSMVPFYGWWRRGGLSFGRAAGVAACVAAAAGVCVLTLAAPTGSVDVAVGAVWWTVPFGAALMGAAFLVAPAPERRGDE